MAKRSKLAKPSKKAAKARKSATPAAKKVQKEPRKKPSGPRATANQRTFIGTLAARLTLAEGELQRVLESAAGVSAVAELRKRSASAVIDALLAREEPGTRPITAKQLKLARKLVRERKVPRSHLTAVLSECSDNLAETLADLSHTQASTVIDELLAWRAKDGAGAPSLNAAQQARLDAAWKGLEEIGWVESWSKLKRERKRRALARLAKGGDAKLRSGLRGVLVDLRVGPFDGEELGYDRLLYDLARASDRAFNPTRIRSRPDGAGNVTIEFDCAGKGRLIEVEEQDLEQFVKLVNKVLEQTGTTGRFLEASRQRGDDDDMCLAFVSPAAGKVAKRRRWF